MEFITVDYIEQVKDRILPFVIFVFVPCAVWWFRFIIGFLESLFSKDG